ncbi:MAG: aldehyde dehydrogenase family protein, partial [Spirochaetales bacterium]
MADITHIVQKQRDFFNTKQTYDITYRKNQLKKLKEALKQYEHEILQALKNDLNKSSFEAFATEIGLVEGEINFMLKNIRRFAKPQRVRTPLMHFPAKSTIVKEPYGLVLIIAPWNYPFQLAMIPLIGAVATGNCVVLKPSNYSQHTSKVIAKMLTSTFDPQYISVVEGDRHANQELLNQKFDHIVFTGSVEIGKHVMEKAARHLTPVTLELGGKSPCIVEKTADIDLAAKRITWGKLLNSGQTCVAPDYI